MFPFELKDNRHSLCEKKAKMKYQGNTYWKSKPSIRLEIKKRRKQDNPMRKSLAKRWNEMKWKVMQWSLDDADAQKVRISLGVRLQSSCYTCLINKCLHFFLIFCEMLHFGCMATLRYFIQQEILSPNFKLNATNIKCIIKILALCVFF